VKKDKKNNKPATIPILFTIPNFITAGSGQVVVDIVKRLNRERFSPAVCVIKRGGALNAVVEDLGIPFIEASFTVSAKPYHLLLGRAFKAARRFKPYRFTVWHSFHYLDDYTEPIIARFAGARAWIYTKKNMAWGARAWHVRTFLAKRVVVANSCMVPQFFTKYANKTLHIPIGIDLDTFRPGYADRYLRDSWQFAGNPIIVAHVANFWPKKNQIYLLKAIAKTRENICLVMAGDIIDHSYFKRLQTFAGEAGLSSRVRFLGKVEDIPNLLRSVDIFAFCSKENQEGLGVAAIEAAACGVPTVVADTLYVKDIHPDDTTALKVPLDDPAACAAAFDELSRNPELRRQLGKAARKRAEEKFNVNDEVKRLEELYLEVGKDPVSNNNEKRP